MRAALVAGLVLGFVAALPGMAGAATFHVDDDAAPGGDCSQATPCQTLEAARAASAAAPGGPHEILMAPGIYDEGAFLIFFMDTAHDALQITGAGSGADPSTDTIVRAPLGLGNNVAPFQTDMGLRHLRIEADVGINAAGSTVEDVHIEQPGAGSTNTVLSLRAPGQVVRDVTIRGGPQSLGIYMQENDLALSPDWTLTDVDVRGGVQGGIVLNSSPANGQLLIQRARIAAPVEAEAALYVNGGAAVESTLITGGQVGATLLNNELGTPQSLLRNVTIDAAAPGQADPLVVGAGEDALPVSVQTTGRGARVESSILLEAVTASGDGIRCDNSNTRSVNAPGAVDCPVGARGNIESAPADLFLAPGSDWSLLPTAPAVDRGATAPLELGESTFDLALAPRLFDGDGDGVIRRDQGAFESQTVPAPPTTPDLVAPAITAAAFGPRRFRPARASTPLAAAKRRRAPRGSKLRFRLSELADVAIRIERALPGRRSRGKCRKPTRRLRGRKRCKRWKGIATLRRAGLARGDATVPFSGRIRGKALRRGSYRAAIVATDLAGNASRARRAGFKIVR